MKTFKHLILASILATIAFTACEKLPIHPGGDNGSDNCIDPSAIRTDMACYALYDPVCGCNNLTYGNSCEAEIAGVKSWTKGACKNDTNGCIDQDKIIPEEDCYCLMYTVYQPVCGCNDVTYNSSCEAECAGVQSYTEGLCNKN